MLKIGSDFYILASSLASRRSTRVLAGGESFALLDAGGDILESPLEALGFFHRDTRYLSCFELKIAGEVPYLLNSYLSDDKAQLRVNLTNPDLEVRGDAIRLARNSIHIERSWVLDRAQMFHRVTVRSYAPAPVTMELDFAYGADFADTFEVRGTERPRRGEFFPPAVNGGSVRLSYRGLDGITRFTEILFDPPPPALGTRDASYRLNLQPDEPMTLEIRITGDAEPRIAAGKPAARRVFADAREARRGEVAGLQAEYARISTSNELMNSLLRASCADLAMISSLTERGHFILAGIPWFATPFGRDGLITALQTLWLHPALAQGVLRFLASTQATEISAFRDAEPGKIMHETRRGEMAALEEVPFGRYYGGVDSTPLFVVLAGAYEQQTGDAALASEIWPQLLKACAWIEARLDRSATGFIDYAAGELSGLVNQGWKDSNDSIFHASGQFPDGPIAVVEVQGYAYAAFVAMSRLAHARKQLDAMVKWRERAAALRARIEEYFWSPLLDYYAIALDGDGARCEVRASNAGHLLYCGVPDQQRADTVSHALMQPDFASGWGLRTLAAGQARYNPMSYHNGSVWPHDAAICAAGMARFGQRQNVVQIVSEMFEAASHFNMRLPELFCGFPRIPGQGPAPYPVACLPQAWSAGAVFMLLQACLNLHIDAGRKEIHVQQPALPIGIENLEVRNLPVGDATIDLTFERLGGEVVVVPMRHAQSGVRVLAHL